MARRLLMLSGLATFSPPLFHGADYGFQAIFEWTNRNMPVTVPNFNQLGRVSYCALLLTRQWSALGIFPSRFHNSLANRLACFR